MAEEVKRDMANAQDVLYAVVGAGDLAVDKVRSAKVDRASTSKLYEDLVKRGRTLSNRIKASGPTKQAIAQTKTARAQVRGAATSVTKAVRANAMAGRSAAKKATTAG